MGCAHPLPRAFILIDQLHARPYIIATWITLELDIWHAKGPLMLRALEGSPRYEDIMSRSTAGP